MRRRHFIRLLSGAAAAWPLPLSAQQQPAKVYRIGYLGMTSHAEYARHIEALKTGLRQLGYEEGKNVVIHYRWADGRYDRLPDLTADLVKLGIDVLITHSTPGARAAKQATSTIPIVVTGVGDPVVAGLVASIARPGGNLTGSTFFFAEVSAKRIELIKEAIPSFTRLAVFVNPTNPSTQIALPPMQHMAGSLQVELVSLEVGARDDIAGAFAKLAGRGAQALTFIEDPLFISNAEYVAELAAQSRLPMIGFKPHAQAGALMGYGVDFPNLWYRSAIFVDKIFKGAKPADLPIERAVKFELVINLKAAKALGVDVPTSILLRADEVIE